MSFKSHLFLVVAMLVCAPISRAVAADVVSNVVVGDWKTGKASVNSVVIQGEDIYLDGVLQKEKYKPGMNVTIRDGKVSIVPQDPARDAEKAAAKASAKESREREKEALKASAKAEKEALKAAAKAEAQATKEAIKKSAAEGLEKGKIKTSTGTVINKGGTVRIGNKEYPDTGPGTEKDIPPDALKAIEDARKLGT